MVWWSEGAIVVESVIRFPTTALTDRFAFRFSDCFAAGLLDFWSFAAIQPSNYFSTSGIFALNAFNRGIDTERTYG